ncbi:hypothetical protein T439DRAFT_328779 [Meredithblackwellia eburnea MCA 4105]
MSDVNSRVTLLNDPSVSRFVFSPPNPYTLKDAIERNIISVKDAQESLDHWIRSFGSGDSSAKLRDGAQSTGRPKGCPFKTIRLIHEDGSEEFVGELEVFRESGFIEIVDKVERQAAVKANLDRQAGDDEIVWTMFFLLLPTFAGQGLITRALRTLFDTFLLPRHLLNVHHILSYAFTDNFGSRRVHEKLGFREVKKDWVEMREDRGGGMREEWVFEWKK